MSKKSIVLVVAVCLLAITPAFADQFAFSYFGTGAAGSYAGSGVATVTPVYWHTYLITSLTGMQNGQAMTLLSPGAFGNNDNLIMDNAPFLDSQGISFAVGGINYNVFNWVSGGTVTGCADSNCISARENGNPATPINFVAAPNAVPEPASFALLGTGLFGLIGIARRKLRG